MSEAKHTPGPWMSIGITPHEQIVREENGEVVAFVPHNMSRNEYEANARLIAAAPDMLATLKDAQEFLRNGRWKREDGVDNILSSVIAKAEGSGSPVTNSQRNAKGIVP